MSEGDAFKERDAGPGRRKHAIGVKRNSVREDEPVAHTVEEQLMPEGMERDGREGTQTRAGEEIGRTAVVQGITVRLGSGDRRTQQSAYVKTSKRPGGASWNSSDYPPQLVQDGLASAGFAPPSVQQTSPPGKHEETVARVKRCLLLADREEKDMEVEERHLQVALVANQGNEAQGEMEIELSLANENTDGGGAVRPTSKRGRIH